MSKSYLGDSVYVELEGASLKLTTWNGYGTSNTIILEPEVYGALEAYVAQLNGGRCSRCGCVATDHEVDDEERRRCTACECTQFEAP